MDLFSLIQEVPIVRVLALLVWMWWQLALAEETMDWYVYISFVFFFIFSILYSHRPCPRICKLILIQELEAEGVGMNIKGTNGGEESGLMVRNMCHILCDIFAITHKKLTMVLHTYSSSNFHSILTTFI